MKTQVNQQHVASTMQGSGQLGMDQAIVEAARIVEAQKSLPRDIREVERRNLLRWLETRNA